MSKQNQGKSYPTKRIHTAHLGDPERVKTRPFKTISVWIAHLP